jgi:hypothetical protein
MFPAGAFKLTRYAATFRRKIAAFGKANQKKSAANMCSSAKRTAVLALDQFFDANGHTLISPMEKSDKLPWLPRPIVYETNTAKTEEVDQEESIEPS